MARSVKVSVGGEAVPSGDYETFRPYEFVTGLVFNSGWLEDLSVTYGVGDPGAGRASYPSTVQMTVLRVAAALWHERAIDGPLPEMNVRKMLSRYDLRTGW